MAMTRSNFGTRCIHLAVGTSLSGCALIDTSNAARTARAMYHRINGENAPDPVEKPMTVYSLDQPGWGRLERALGLGSTEDRDVPDPVHGCCEQTYPGDEEDQRLHETDR